MEEEVQGGPARGRGRGGRGTRRRGCGRCMNRSRGLDGLEDAAVGGGSAVVRLIEEDMNMSVGMGVVELTTLIGSGLLMLLKMATTTTNSLLFWAFHIKRLEASYVSGWRKVVYKDCQKAELATSNWQMACKPSLEISCYNSLSPLSPRLVRNWRFASQRRQF